MPNSRTCVRPVATKLAERMEDPDRSCENGPKQGSDFRWSDSPGSHSTVSRRAERKQNPEPDRSHAARGYFGCHPHHWVRRQRCRGCILRLSAYWPGNSTYSSVTSNTVPESVLALPTILYSYSITQPDGVTSGYSPNGKVVAYTDSVNGQWTLTARGAMGLISA
jgi:hypothetical protein